MELKQKLKTIYIATLNSVAYHERKVVIMYNTMFKNLKEVSESDVILKANFDHMFYDDTITRTFILNLEDCEEDTTIKQYLNNWGIKHNYYLIDDTIEIFDNCLNKLNI